MSLYSPKNPLRGPRILLRLARVSAYEKPEGSVGITTRILYGLALETCLRSHPRILILSEFVRIISELGRILRIPGLVLGFIQKSFQESSKNQLGNRPSMVWKQLLLRIQRAKFPDSLDDLNKTQRSSPGVSEHC